MLCTCWSNMVSAGTVKKDNCSPELPLRAERTCVGRISCNWELRVDLFVLLCHCSPYLRPCCIHGTSVRRCAGTRGSFTCWCSFLEMYSAPGVGASMVANLFLYVWLCNALPWLVLLLSICFLENSTVFLWWVWRAQLVTYILPASDLPDTHLSDFSITIPARPTHLWPLLTSDATVTKKAWAFSY